MTWSALPSVKSRILRLDMLTATQRAQIIMDQADSGRITALLDDRWRFGLRFQRWTACAPRWPWALSRSARVPE